MYLNEQFSIRQNRDSPEPLYFVGRNAHAFFLGKMGHIPYTNGDFETLCTIPEDVHMNKDVHIVPMHNANFGTLLILFGGTSDVTTWLYCLVLDKWFKLEDLPRPVFRAGIQVLHDSIYDAAGYGYYKSLQTEFQKMYFLIVVF